MENRQFLSHSEVPEGDERELVRQSRRNRRRRNEKKVKGTLSGFKVPVEGLFAGPLVFINTRTSRLTLIALIHPYHSKTLHVNVKT